jgi:curved DNA-binding protein
MEFKDYYQILGVKKDATEIDIKKAYRKLARKYHPDVSKEADAEKRMQAVNEANDVLSDPQKRVAYDKLGTQFQAGQDFKPPPNWDEGYEFSGKGFSRSEGFSDFFDELFKRAGRAKKTDAIQTAGEDRHAKIVIDIADSYHGKVRSITLHVAQEDELGKVTKKERTLNVKIPKGAQQGQHIRLTGEGYPGSGGGKSGDLYLEVVFNTEPDYSVEGRDVYKALPVAPWEAALGAKVEAQIPSGPVSVKVPADSQSGRKLRLKGLGLPGDPPGDFYLVLKIVLPPNETGKARQLYETMAKELPFDPRIAMRA